MQNDNLQTNQTNQNDSTNQVGQQVPNSGSADSSALYETVFNLNNKIDRLEKKEEEKKIRLLNKMKLQLKLQQINKQLKKFL